MKNIKRKIDAAVWKLRAERAEVANTRLRAALDEQRTQIAPRGDDPAPVTIYVTCADKTKREAVAAAVASGLTALEEARDVARQMLGLADSEGLAPAEAAAVIASWGPTR